MKYLVKFYNKRDIRRLLRYNYINRIAHSSIYKIDDISYILLHTNTNLKFPNYVSLELIENPSILEQYLFAWAESEILQTINYIQYEQNSTLADNCRKIVYSGKSIYRCFDPLVDIMGILNYTPDSFSDGGKFNNVDAAIKLIRRHCQMGASIIDLGVESTRPGGITSIDASGEINILKEILPKVLEFKREFGFQLSIDAYRPETIRWLLDFEVDIFNDVSGKLPLDLVKEILVSNRRYIAMHSLTIPVNTKKWLDSNINPIDYLKKWQQDKLESILNLVGDISNFILDPGIGFGLDPAQSWYTIRHLDKISNVPCEYLLGASRKTYFNHITDKSFSLRDIETAIVNGNALSRVDYIRIHDLELFNQVIPVFNQLG